MQSEKMAFQNLINEIVDDYAQSKYDGGYLKEKIKVILEFIIPHIATIVENKGEKQTINLWNAIKEDEKINNFFMELLEKVDRAIVIYVASKFKNNKYFGVRIIEEALRLQNSFQNKNSDSFRIRDSDSSRKSKDFRYDQKSGGFLTWR